jgi:hypothetical protein
MSFFLCVAAGGDAGALTPQNALALGNQNPTLLASLDETQVNLAYAESDEGGGVHNHPLLDGIVER